MVVVIGLYAVALAVAVAGGLVYSVGFLAILGLCFIATGIFVLGMIATRMLDDL